MPHTITTKDGTAFAFHEYELPPLGPREVRIQVTFAAVAIAAGAVGDLMLWRLRPSSERVRQVRAFAFLLPVAYFAIYLGVVVLFVGSGWTIHSLTGVVLLSGVIGLLLSFVSVGGRETG